MKKSKTFFGLKSLFVMTYSQKKYLRIFEEFEHCQIHWHFQGVLAIAKLFLLGRGIEVMSRGERLLARSFATVLKDGSVATV